MRMYHTMFVSNVRYTMYLVCLERQALALELTRMSILIFLQVHSYYFQVNPEQR